MRAGGLAATLLLAKAFALEERGISISLLSFPAYVWQDIAVAVAFWAIDRALRQGRWLWIPYAAITGYVIVNIPVVTTLGAPLTATMIRAAGGALGDSMRSALTGAVAIKMAIAGVAALAGPWMLARLSPAVRRGGLVTAAVVLAVGAVSAKSIDTNGLQRNAMTAFVSTAVPRIGVAADGADFRASPFGDGQGENLTRYRRSAGGYNVLMVVLESTAARYLAPYGAADDPTPVITALARQSIVFDAAYAAYPESIKGLFAVLCSTAPALDVPAEAHARAPCDSVVGRLGREGYRTGLFHAGRFGYLGMQEIIDVHRFDKTEDAGTISGRVQSSFGVDEPAVVTRILEWIDHAPRNRPFFATYLPAAGHHPYQSASGPFPMDTDLGVYKNAIHEGDAAVGTLLAGLRARGLADRTVVVVFGDHGEAFDQHPGNRAHSLYIYDENVHVPLLVHLPSRTSDSSPTRVKRVVSVLDIGPTILDLVGARPQEGIQGVSLLEPRERMALFHADYDRAWLGLRDACWKFLLDVDAGRARVFDVCADPGETVDLSERETARREAYRTRVEAWAAAQRAAILGAGSAPRRPE